MPSRKFRKLDVELPRQRIVNQRPWLVAGIILALIILLVSALAFIANIK